ncbi:MAG: Gfo/Idh/MocA family protein [Saprospiraceae bacterium]
MKRRPFLKQLALLTAATPIACTLGAAGSAPRETSSPAALREGSEKKKLGIALVGLGYYSIGELGPALKISTDSYLAGVVTGDPEVKGKEWAKEHGFPETSIYNYENFDSIKDNPDIDVVYVVLPNSMHEEFVTRAALAGKHVICEKPMAMNPAQAERMIAACKNAGVKLGIGYRCRYDPFTIATIERAAELGPDKVRFIRSHAGYQMGDNWEQWRLKKALAGTGALGNMGVYALQGAIYAAGENPISVSAQEFKTNAEKFAETDETVTFQLRFPSGAVANCATSHSASMNDIRVDYSGNDFVEIDQFSAYRNQVGKTEAGPMEYPKVNQQALQMDAFSRHVRDGEANLVPGEMGLRDMQILEAILKSIKEGGKTIPLKDLAF